MITSKERLIVLNGNRFVIWLLCVAGLLLSDPVTLQTVINILGITYWLALPYVCKFHTFLLERFKKLLRR